MQCCARNGFATSSNPDGATTDDAVSGSARLERPNDNAPARVTKAKRMRNLLIFRQTGGRIGGNEHSLAYDNDRQNAILFARSSTTYVDLNFRQCAHSNA